MAEAQKPEQAKHCFLPQWDPFVNHQLANCPDAIFDQIIESQERKKHSQKRRKKILK